MTVLGEAFIEVRSDLKPFIRDLDKEVKAAAERMEKTLQASISNGISGGAGGRDGERLGEELGDGVGRGMKRQLGDKGKPPWVQIAAALGSALDDGLSALPVEVKAGIVTGIVAALPFLSAAIAGATTAALGAGLAGLGTLLAFQYTQVEEAGLKLTDKLREELVGAAQPFVNVLRSSFQFLENRIEGLRPRLDRIFATASTFVGPLIEGLADAFDFITESFDNIGDDMKPFVKELANGFAIIGIAIGDSLEILASTGEEGVEGLRDLFFAAGQLIGGFARLVQILTEVYGVVRDISLAVPYLVGPLAFFFQASDEAATGVDEYGNATEGLTEKILGTVSATDRETKSLKEAAAAMDKARDSAFGLIDATLDYEESIDDLSDTLKENGRTFTAETEKGRENIRALGDAIKAAQADSEKRYAEGKLSAEEANALYRQEVDEILRIAKAHGISEEAIRGVYDEAIKLVNLPQPDTGWLNQIASGANLTAAALERALKAAQRLNSGAGGVGGGPGPGGHLEFGDGAIVHAPVEATVGDGGSEVIIPLTKPARAAQLMQMSGLDRMLQPANSMVQVFIGNEQLDPHVIRIVESNNTALGNSLAFGARGL
jgi:hypothetical protein